MLNIYFGTTPDAIYDTATYFNNTYLDNWITDERARKIIRAVDKAEVLSPQAVDSKALGVIPVTGLSGGTKTLLLIDHMPDKVFNASTCGDNCAEWLLKIAEAHEEDITVNLHHIMDFDHEGKGKPFDIRIVNNGKLVHSMSELVPEAGLLLGGDGIV